MRKVNKPFADKYLLLRDSRRSSIIIAHAPGNSWENESMPTQQTRKQTSVFLPILLAVWSCPRESNISALFSLVIKHRLRQMVTMPWSPNQRQTLALEKGLLEKYFGSKVSSIEIAENTKVPQDFGELQNFFALFSSFLSNLHNKRWVSQLVFSSTFN